MQVKFAPSIGLLAAVCLVAAADEPEPRGKIPQFERYLRGADAKLQVELREKIEVAERANDYIKAVRLCEELLELRRRAQGDDHWQAVIARWELDRRRKIAALPASKQEEWRKVLAGGYEAVRLGQEGKTSAAGELWEAYSNWCAREFGEEHPTTAESYQSRALNLEAQGKYADAQPQYEKVVAYRKKVLGENHPDTAICYVRLALNLNRQYLFNEADRLLRAPGHTAQRAR
jgi:hypothetical protein